jgi:hypothetical protein
MDTFSPNNPPRIQLELRDRSGVSKVWAHFNHADTPSSYMVLGGDGSGQTEALVTLTLSTYSSYLAPGEYRCRQIEASDAAGYLSTFTPETHPELASRNFRYEYPGGESDDTEGPELVGFLRNAITRLTAPEVTLDELRRYAEILRATMASGAGVKEAQKSVRQELPELAALTEEIGRTRNTQLRIFLIKVVLTIIGWILVAQTVNIQDVNVDVDLDQLINVTVEQDDPGR